MASMFYVSMVILTLFCLVVWHKYDRQWNGLRGDEKVFQIFIPSILWPLSIPLFLGYILLSNLMSIMDKMTTNVADKLHGDNK